MVYILRLFDRGIKITTISMFMNLVKITKYKQIKILAEMDTVRKSTGNDRNFKRYRS